MKKATIVLIGMCVSLVSCASSQKKIQEANAKSPQYQYSLGAFHLNNNNLDEALKYFQRALALDSRHSQSLNALGLVYTIKGNFAEAEKSLLKCLEVSPGFVEARNNLGVVYQEMGFPDRAEAEFKKVIADPAYPTKESPYYNLARLCSLRQDWENALFYADKAIQANPRYHMGFALKGFALDQQEKYDEAIQSYKEALKFLPDDVSYNFSLASAHFKNGDFQSAESILEKILSRITDPEMKKTADSYLKAIREREKGPGEDQVPSSHAAK